MSRSSTSYDPGDNSLELAVDTPNSTTSYGQVTSTPPRRRKRKLCAITWAWLLCLFPVTFLAVVLPYDSTSYGERCTTDGRFITVGSEGIYLSGILDFTLFFQITLGTGEVTFTAAKVIDVIWDIIVGRGGQLCLTGICFVVFSQVLLYLMETRPVSYPLFAKIALDPASIWSLRSMVRRSPCRARKSSTSIFMFCMVLATIYVVAFPTMMGSMTGYVTSWDAYLNTTQGEYLPFDQFQQAEYLVTDGDRINRTKDLIVYGLPSITKADDLAHAISTYLYRMDQNATKGNYLDPNCRNYYRCPLNITSNITIDGKIFQLKAPTLNISDWNAEDQYVYDNTTYMSTYINTHAVCQPGSAYQWGFSALQLMIVCCLHFVWSTIMYGMWIHVRRNGRLIRYNRQLGTYRALMDLATAIREELGPEAEFHTNRELRAALQKPNAGMVVKENSLMVTSWDRQSPVPRKSTSSSFLKDPSDPTIMEDIVLGDVPKPFEKRKKWSIPARFTRLKKEDNESPR